MAVRAAKPSGRGRSYGGRASAEKPSYGLSSRNGTLISSVQLSRLELIARRTLPEREKRPSWIERQEEKFLRKAQENPETEARLRNSWFGRMMLRTAERTRESWEPEVGVNEHIELSTRAERVTIASIISGHLTLTDNRLIFTPAMELSRVPWMIRTSQMPRSEIRARKGLFLSRGVHFKYFFLHMVLPGLLHIANLKVKHRRRAWWLRVEDPKKWAAAISAASGEP